MTRCFNCRERETKLRFRDSQRGLGGSYMRTAVTTLQLLLELVSDEQVRSVAGQPHCCSGNMLLAEETQTAAAAPSAQLQSFLHSRPSASCITC